MSVFFYISGHGFGHAVRQIEIINALAARAPSVPIVIRTTAPRWLFERTPRCAYTLLEGEVDTGVVQRDSLSLDAAETIRRAAAFYGELERLAAAETSLLQQHRAAIVVADAPPLACAAADRAGIPSAVCANFTWDWIYAEYSEHLRETPGLLPAIRDAYGKATAGWRMPLHGGFQSITPIVDVPFVARHSRRDMDREELRRRLRLPIKRPLALVSFGGYGLEELPLDRLDCAPRWGIVVTGVGSLISESSAAENRDLTPVIRVAESDVYRAGFRYEDIVCAVDVVISKPGYGIISDCVANGTALLYTSRGRFAEYDVLVAGMSRYIRCRFIDGQDLRSGRWGEALDALVTSPSPPETARVDGADVVAEMIAGQLRRPT